MRYDIITGRDGSIRPSTDTGFRFTPTAPHVYVRKPNPPTKKIWDVSFVHEDDIVKKTPTRLRGVNHIEIDVLKARERNLR